MTLLEILLLELESWPEGKEFAFQSTTTSRVYFASTDEKEDADLKAVLLCQIASERGLEHSVTRDGWETSKVKSLAFFPQVAAILGEEKAVKELLAVGNINYEADELIRAFVFEGTPQGYDFWVSICEPSEDINDPSRDSELKAALDIITAAMSSGHFIQLHPDGSGYVGDTINDEVISFDNTDELVKEYLSPTPKFEHWGTLQDRFQWIAKDSDGSWWAYVNQPDLGYEHWEYSEECHSLEILKFDIPCHWKRSLIERPTPL